MHRRVLAGAALALAAAARTSFAAANTPSAHLELRYHDLLRGEHVTDSRPIEVPPGASQEPTYSDPRMEKTALLVDVISTVRSALTAYHGAACAPLPPCVSPRLPFASAAATTSLPGVSTVRPVCRQEPRTKDSCIARRQTIGEELKGYLGGARDLALSRDPAVVGEDVLEAIDLFQKLAHSMSRASVPKPPQPRPLPLPIVRTAPSAILQAPTAVLGAKAATGLAVTAGGAQNFSFARTRIEEGAIPEASSLSVEGFLTEFELPLSSPACEQNICVNVATAQKSLGETLFVQLSLGSKVTAESFARKPLNVSLVIDVSGSMSALDGTDRSRLEWAKAVSLETLGELEESDLLSVVTFATESEIVLEPTGVSDREGIASSLSALTAGGSTNLGAGLSDGLSLAAQAFVEGYENRVILISDAGLNTGVTDETELFRMVSEYANEGVGLTAIGLGSNFKQDFIEAVTGAQGGNYLFVQSGLEMFRLFDNFDFLVSPIAENFVVDLDIEGYSLVNAYGVPQRADGSLAGLLDVQTLFFAGSGGGAIFLELSRQQE